MQITQLYNKCRKPLILDDEDNGDAKKPEDEQLNSNICSNMYPALLLPYKSIDFGHVLQVGGISNSFQKKKKEKNLTPFPQLASQQRIEQNSLDLMFGLFNMGEQEAWRDNANESNCSSIEILRILTLNLTGDGEFQQYLNENNHDYAALALNPDMARLNSASQRGTSVTLRSKHIDYFLQNERSFVAQFIEKAFDICPTIFGKKYLVELLTKYL